VARLRFIIRADCSHTNFCAAACSFNELILASSHAADKEVWSAAATAAALSAAATAVALSTVAAAAAAALGSKSSK
jgi:hypothetical protein